MRISPRVQSHAAPPEVFVGPLRCDHCGAGLRELGEHFELALLPTVRQHVFGFMATRIEQRWSESQWLLAKDPGQACDAIKDNTNSVLIVARFRKQGEVQKLSVMTLGSPIIMH